jgi:hypothetical protein
MEQVMKGVNHGTGHNQFKFGVILTWFMDDNQRDSIHKA